MTGNANAQDAVSSLRASSAFTELRMVSERLGRNPLQVQGPGGNTSLKADDVMLVKASGTLLADAVSQDIMIPIDAGALRRSLLAQEAVEGQAFTIDEADLSGLRPSIETAVHAVLDWPVVLHTHCVATIAVAVRADAEAVVHDRLAGLDAVFVPYRKPGEELARAILERVKPETQVLVLGNHGLVVCAHSALEGEALIGDVARRLEASGADARTGRKHAPDPNFAAALAAARWRFVEHAPTQEVALDHSLLTVAEGATLYPDHAIFLGPGVAIIRSQESLEESLARVAAATPCLKLVLVEGRGAAIPADASPSVIALAHAFGDVLVRIDPKASLNRLTSEQEADLLNWDAEKYRQALEQARAGGAM